MRIGALAETEQKRRKREAAEHGKRERQYAADAHGFIDRGEYAVAIGVLALALAERLAAGKRNMMVRHKLPTTPSGR